MNNDTQMSEIWKNRIWMNDIWLDNLWWNDMWENIDRWMIYDSIYMIIIWMIGSLGDCIFSF